MNLNRFQTLCRVLKTDLVFEAPNGNLTTFFDPVSLSPLMQSEDLRRTLREGAKGLDAAYLFTDAHDCCFACIRMASVADDLQAGADADNPQTGTVAGESRDEEESTSSAGYLYMGPMCQHRLVGLPRARMYNSYGISGGDYPSLPVFTLPQIRDMVDLTAYYLDQNRRADEDVLHAGSILVRDETATLRDQTAFVLNEEEENDNDAYRHSYHEEQLLMQAVREGKPQEAVRLAESMDHDSGQLSRDSMRHRRNLAMIGIALCARAAIEGGLAPESAYRISGYYIEKCDAAYKPAQLLRYRNEAIEEMAGRIAKHLSKPSSSSYVERCRDYIRKHYREKIYLQDIADSLGISPSYLSRLYMRETGEGVQDYISRVRVDRSVNLLLYSDRSLSEIAQYVGFPNQSYFGKIFRKYMNMSPRAYQGTHAGTEYRK